MKKDILIAVVIFLILTGSAVMKFYYQDRAQDTQPADLSTIDDSLGEVFLDEKSIASDIAESIDFISPTQAGDPLGWIVQKISFVSGTNRAFAEYTDTHIALRLLLEYSYKDLKLQTKVLATYIPTEQGGWTLQNGKDETAGRGMKSYVYNGDAEQWIPEMASE